MIEGERCLCKVPFIVTFSLGDEWESLSFKTNLMVGALKCAVPTFPKGVQTETNIGAVEFPTFVNMVPWNSPQNAIHNTVKL